MNIYTYNYQTQQWDKDNKISYNCWVSPCGEVFNCEAHEVEAEYIVNQFFGEEMLYYGDFLIEKGWVKFTTSFMSDLYEEQGLYDNLTDEQLQVYQQYFDFNR